jgi:ABC-type uncharacterized transport system permease subunit
MVWIGVVLSAVVVAAAVWFASRDSGNAPAPELAWIYDFIAVVIAGVALVFIWIGVLLAKLADKRDEDRRRREG